MRRLTRPRRFVVVLLSTAGLFAWFTSNAAAEFGPIQLVSKSAKEQAGFAREPALSADGRYLAFYGELGGHTGIFRKELVSGALTLVVEGAAEAPSISAEGRYVSFTTTQSLEPVADSTAGSKDVYVADLANSPPTYQLASAVEVEGHEQRMSGSSSAAPRVALSADGGEVAFVNEGQVYVRRLAESEPTLISTKRAPITGAMTTEPVSGGGAYQPAGAALSAEGNVVAWVGEHLPEQVSLLHDEEEAVQKIDATSEGGYREPLWREVPSGTSDPATRRIVGGGDPVAPGCPTGGTLTEAACVGPFPSLTSDHGWEGVAERNVGKGWGINLPQLSADGDTVAVIGSPEEIEDLFVVNMEPGLSRTEAMRQLTRWTDPAPSLLRPEQVYEKAEYQVYAAPIRECAISPDGEHVAFTTQRQVFPLSPPTLTTAKPAPLPTVAELYQVNLEGQTIERITPGPGTGVSIVGGVETKLGETTLGAAAPSYSTDGRILAFASSAYNIVAGDGNGSSDVFTVESKPLAAVQPSTISPPPSSILIQPPWLLTAHAVSRPDGAVRVVASVPGMGTVSAGATSQLGSGATSRRVSTAHRTARAAGVVRLELSLPRHLRNLARRKGGLYASLGIRFSGPGGKPLEQRLSARFRVHGRASSAKKGKG